MLTNSDKLSDSKTEQLQSILQDHHDLAVCYAMKEEMCRLYELTDYQQAVIGWTKWFQAAKVSEIPALVRFAVQKEKRLPGLAAHAIYSISTGKLEGFKNKIKVAKRIGYGYRDDDFFFTLIRYLSIPSVRSPSHKKSWWTDKFKGNTNSETYQCILTDPVNKVVLDILPKRYEHFLTEYFNCFDKSQRDKVQFFVSDMWKPYSNISSVR